MTHTNINGVFLGKMSHSQFIVLPCVSHTRHMSSLLPAISQIHSSPFRTLQVLSIQIACVALVFTSFCPGSVLSLLITTQHLLFSATSSPGVQKNPPLCNFYPLVLVCPLNSVIIKCRHSTTQLSLPLVIEQDTVPSLSSLQPASPLYLTFLIRLLDPSSFW